MRNALSIARGASLLTSVPKAELMSWSRLTMPRPIVTGSISMKTCLMRGSRQSMWNARRKSIRPSAPKAIPSWTKVATRIAIARAYSASPFSGPPWKCGCSTTSSTMITTFQTAGEIAGIVKCS